VNISVGALGVIGMGIIAVAGVWLSMRISLGADLKNHSSFAWWVVNRLAFLIGAANLGGFMVFFLQEKLPDFQGELAAVPASLIIMFVGIFILLTALPGGYLADRLGKKTLIAASGVLAGLGTAVVILASSITTIIVGGCIIGAGVGLFYPANWALGTELVPSDRSAQFLGLSNLAGAGAGAVGAYLGGPIADRMGYLLVMAIYGALAFFSIFGLLGIKPKH
jgi:MFS family permease